jgi:hypothetical protein
MFPSGSRCDRAQQSCGREERDVFDGKQEPYWSRALLGPLCAWVGACVCVSVSASVRLCVFVFYLPLHFF